MEINIKTIHWVLEGEIANFPLMYHHRIIPFSGQNLGHLIRSPYDSCSEDEKRRIMKKYGIKEGLKLYEVGAILLDNIEQIHADGDMNLDEFYVASIVKDRSIITLMQNFFSDMWGNHKKDTKLDHAKLQRLLKETGFLSNKDV